jgi:hypothetical protein
MPSQAGRGPLSEQDVDVLCRLLATETSFFRKLLELARGQARCLRDDDLEGLEQNAADWQKTLPGAEQVQRQRQEQVRQWLRDWGVTDDPITPQSLLALVDDKSRGIVNQAILDLGRAAGELFRQNALNRQLAAFCCDLVREEAEIFKRCVLENPAGCYAGDAQKVTESGRGFFIRRA